MLNKIDSRSKMLQKPISYNRADITSKLRQLREMLRATVEYKQTMSVGSIQYNNLQDQARAIRELINSLTN